jgi:hypothetical protein
MFLSVPNNRLADERKAVQVKVAFPVALHVRLELRHRFQLQHVLDDCSVSVMRALSARQSNTLHSLRRHLDNC